MVSDPGDCGGHPAVSPGVSIVVKQLDGVKSTGKMEGHDLHSLSRCLALLKQVYDGVFNSNPTMINKLLSPGGS